MKWLSIILISFWINFSLVAQAPEVQWYTLEEALEKNEKVKKKIMVDIYTDWCGWCKRMDNNTFQNPAIAEYINKHFYPVKFNAEQKSNVIYKGKTYNFIKKGNRGYHELAAEFVRSLGGRLSYPTIVFLDKNNSIIQPVPGYKSPEEFEVIMHFIGDDYYLSQPWESFEKGFISSLN